MGDTQDDRLLSLEESVRASAASTERVVIGLEVLGERVTEGFKAVAGAHDQFAKAQESLNERLKPIEEERAKKLKRTELVKKLALPGLGATAGVFGAKFGNEILAVLHKLFGL